MVKMTNDTTSPIEISVTFPTKLTSEPKVAEPVAVEPNVDDSNTSVLPRFIPTIPSSTDDCVNMMTTSTELKSKILENMKAMDDIRRKVEETRATTATANKGSIPAPLGDSVPTPLLVFNQMVSTVRDRLTTVHQKDFKQHTDVIRDDIVSFLGLIPKSDVGEKLKTILSAE